jgi:hypothetical protein
MTTRTGDGGWVADWYPLPVLYQMDVYMQWRCFSSWRAQVLGIERRGNAAVALLRTLYALWHCLRMDINSVVNNRRFWSPSRWAATDVKFMKLALSGVVVIN